MKKPRQQTYRERLVEKGLVQVATWIPEGDREKHARYVAGLRKRAGCPLRND